MISKSKTIMILLLALLAGGCARGDEVTRQAAEATAAPQAEVAIPSVTATVRAVATAAATSTLTQTLTETPQPTATATPETVLAIYASDGNPCNRPLYPGETAGGLGLQPAAIIEDDPRDETGAVIARFPHPYISYATFIAPDGELIATHDYRSDSGYGDINIWDLETGEKVTQLQHDYGYYAIAASLKTPRLVAMAGLGEVWLMDLSNAAGIRAEMVVDIRDRGLPALSPDGSIVALSLFVDGGYGYWGKTYLIDVETGRILQRLEGEVVETVVDAENGSEVKREMINGHGAPIDWAGFSPNGQALLTLSWIDRTMRLWDVTSGEHLRCFELGGLREIESAAFSPDGREIAAVSGEEILIWDTAASDIDRRFNFLDILDLRNGSAVFAPGGESIITFYKDERTAYVWDNEDGKLSGVLRHTDAVKDLQASPDGQYIVTSVRQEKGTFPSAAWVWDARHPSLSLAAEVEILVVNAFERGEQGDIEGMLLSFAEARSLAPDESAILRPADWDRICRYGILGGEAMTVLEACETAVAVVEDQATDYESEFTLAKYRDSRGAARALSGDLAGAIEDFQYYVENKVDPDMFTFDPYSREANLAQARHEMDLWQHQEWINEMENGRIPFDAATLEAFWNEIY